MFKYVLFSHRLVKIEGKLVIGFSGCGDKKLDPDRKERIRR